MCYEEGIKRLSGNFCDTCGQDKDNCICTENQIKLNHITAPFSYSGFIKKYIHAFKFGGKKHFYRKLGKEMSHRFVVSYPGIKADMVTFVPLSEKSYSERLLGCLWENYIISRIIDLDNQPTCVYRFQV